MIPLVQGSSPCGPTKSNTNETVSQRLKATVRNLAYGTAKALPLEQEQAIHSFAKAIARQRDATGLRAANFPTCVSRRATMSQVSSAMISVLDPYEGEERDTARRAGLGCVVGRRACLDSCSTDATVEIARATGAPVHSRAFDDYATHRNAALALAFERPLVFLLERRSSGLRRSCAQRCSAWWARRRPTRREFACVGAIFSSAHG